MSRKLFLTILAMLLAVVGIQAQTTNEVSSIRAKMVDSESNEAVIGAVAELKHVSDTTRKRHVSSERNGTIRFLNVAPGSYTLTVSFMGYVNNVTQVNVKGGGAEVDLGVLKMELESRKIDAVKYVGQAIRTSQEGDTVVYNADAFKVAKDADAEGLLAKMPGIKVIDGKVEAQGEQVKKVFVDGKEFFGGDVTTAIKNLPAEVVSKIEVFNKLSDQAEFSGVDDGEGFKALNIVTTVKRGQFGKIYGGYGYSDKYIAGANMSFFTKDHRVTLLGMTNNINQQNFAMEDILGAMSAARNIVGSSGGHTQMMQSRASGGVMMLSSQPGVATVTSLGVNYTGQWSDKMSVISNYFFNHTKNDNTRFTDRLYTLGNEQYQSLDTQNSTRANYENRLFARIEYKFNKNNSIMFRPRVNIQSFDSESRSQGPYSLIGSDGSQQLIRTLQNLSESKKAGYTLANYATYRSKLGKDGRVLTIFGGGSYTNSDQSSMNQELITPADPLASIADRRRKGDGESQSYSLSGGIVYSEPIAKFTQLTMRYRIRYDYSDSENRVYIWDPAMEEYDSEMDNDQSSILNSGYLTHSVGPGFNFSKNRNVVTGGVSYQRSTLVGTQKMPTPGYDIDRSFDNIVYMLMVNRVFNPANTLRFTARSSTNNPSVGQLQNFVDRTSQQMVTAGNPSLTPSYTHSFYANYNRSNPTKGRTFMVMASLNAESNYISDSLLIATPGGAPVILEDGMPLNEGAQFVKPINMDGRWNMNGMVSFGMPLKFIRSNLNLNAGGLYSETPSMINGEKSLQKGQFYNAGIVLSSNINENVDFTLAYNGGYNIVKNSIQIANSISNDNKYLSHSASFRFKVVLWAGFTLSGDANYSQYKGITNKFNEEYLICNAYIGKKIFKNQRGEISVGVNDIFNQNTSFSRNVTSSYIENVKNSAIGRYVGFKFTYMLRSIGKDNSSKSAPAPQMMPQGGGSQPVPGGRPAGGFPM